MEKKNKKMFKSQEFEKEIKEKFPNPKREEEIRKLLLKYGFRKIYK